MELMDIKWCLASVLRRAEKFKTITGRNDFLDAHVSTIGFDKSKVTCFRCREKGHFKRECKGREASGAQNPFGKDDYYRKAIYQQVGRSQEPQTAHGGKIEDPKRACLVDFSLSDFISSEATAARIIDQDDEKLPEGFSWDMFVDENGDYKAFIAKIVREPDLFATWMKSIGVNVPSGDEKSVSSDESSDGVDDKISERSGEISTDSDENVEYAVSFDESVQNEIDSEKAVVFDKSPTVSDLSDNESEKSAHLDQSPVHNSSDDEGEKLINVAKTHLSPKSFHVYFADCMEKLKGKRAAKEQQTESESDVQNAENVAEKITEVVIEVEKVVEVEKVIEVVKTIEVEKIIEVIKPCKKCLEDCKNCATKDDIISEYEKKKEQLLFNLNYVKESYDVLSKTVTGLQTTNSEREQALTMMNATLMSKQKAINFYIEESAKWKQELEIEKIENERIRRLLLSYTTSDYLIDRVYPTVAGLEAFQDEKQKKKNDCGGSSDEEQKKPFWKQSNQEFLAERKRNGAEVFYQRETRTCYRCNEVGHIAWNCTQNTKAKQGASRKLKEKVVDVEPPTEKLRMFENSKFEVGEYSQKNKYEKIGKDNQVWVAKKDEVNVGDESGSTKPEEPQVEKKILVNDEEFPSSKFEEVKKKVGKTEISNQ
ncbi:putative transcription factor interactor and regulator CCHC(Zn) family [Helianthus debilis subsp. tardiflorus]